MAGLPTLEELEIYRQEAVNAEREGRPCTLRDPREVYKEDPNLESYLVYLTDKEISEAQKVMDEAVEKKLENLAAVQESQNENRESPQEVDEDSGEVIKEGQPEITDEVIEERLPETRVGETDRRVAVEHGMSEDLFPEPHVTSAPDAQTVVAQEVNEEQANIGADTESTHQNTQSTPNPEFLGGVQPEIEDGNVTPETEENARQAVEEARQTIKENNQEKPEEEVAGFEINSPETQDTEAGQKAEDREQSHLEGTHETPAEENKDASNGS